MNIPNLMDRQNKPVRKLRLNWKIKAGAALVVILLITFGAYKTIQAINNFFDKNTFVFKPVVEMQFNKPISIEQRKTTTTEIVNVVESVPEPKNLETDAEKYIYEKFGIENYKIAIAVGRAESGLERGRVGSVNNNGTIDYGEFQINQIHWNPRSDAYKPICDMTLISTTKGNIDCAYYIWDMADKVEGNHEGSWGAWSVFNNGSFTGLLK